MAALRNDCMTIRWRGAFSLFVTFPYIQRGWRSCALSPTAEWVSSERCEEPL